MKKAKKPTFEKFRELFVRLGNDFNAAIIPALKMIDMIIAARNDGSLSEVHKKGLEIGLERPSQDGKRKVVMWSSLLWGENVPRDHDIIWLLIKDYRYKKPCFYSFPIRWDDGHCLETAYRYFKALVKIIDNWPASCPICGAEPKIDLVRGKFMHDVAFFCPNNRHHKLLDHSFLQAFIEGDEDYRFLKKKFDDNCRYQLRNLELPVEDRPNFARVTRSQRKKLPPEQKSIGRTIDDSTSQINPKADEFPFNDLQYEQ